jgi:hypothetical protein
MASALRTAASLDSLARSGVVLAPLSESSAMAWRLGFVRQTGPLQRSTKKRASRDAPTGKHTAGFFVCVMPH